MLSGSTVCPQVDCSQSENCDLASRLARRKSARKAASPASHFNPAISLKSVVQPSPIASEITLESAGLAISSQRRGVTPLVLLLKRSGNISAKSLTVVARSNCEWMAATPLVLCEPTIARLAIRTLFGPLFDQAHARDAGLVVGIAAPDVVQETAVDLEDDLELPRDDLLEVM